MSQTEEVIEGVRGLMAKCHSDTKALINRIEAQGREPTPSEQRQLDKLFNQFDAFERELRALDVESDEAEAMAELAALPRPRKTPPSPIGSFVNGSAYSAPATTRLSGSPRSWAGMFGNAAASAYSGRFDSLAEFVLAAISGNDSRLLRNATMTEGTGADGGFAVPTQFLAPILDAALQREIVRPRANVIPIISRTAVAGLFDSSDGTSSKRAGLQLLFGAEAAALTEQKAKVRELALVAHKGSIFVRVSSELASDAPNFDRQLSEAMIAAVAAGLDSAFVNGTGAGQPLGILNAPNLITVNKEGSQAANTIAFANLATMVGRLAPSSFANAVWLVHPTAVPKLYTMAYVTRNAGDTDNVSGVAAAAITQAPDGSLSIFGRPVLITDACSVLSAAGDVILADLSRYVVGLRADATIVRDASRYFDSDELAFRLVLRCDGQGADAAATKLRDGSNTVSPFVTLQAR